jgi:hypothetical protein
MSYDRLPDQITGPMTTSQATTLQSLDVEASHEKLFRLDLSRAEVAKKNRSPEARDRIGELLLSVRKTDLILPVWIPSPQGRADIRCQADRQRK